MIRILTIDAFSCILIEIFVFIRIGIIGFKIKRDFIDF